AMSATALAMLLISPVSWSHHWVWITAVLPAFAWTLRETPARCHRLRTAMTAVLLVSVLVFVFSPKTIGMAFDAENLDVQTPGLWIMASSAGVLCAVAVLLCWLAVLRRGALATDEPLTGVSVESLLQAPAEPAAEPAVATPAAAPSAVRY
ncbi:MAG TPA: hypothetical protein VD841_09330, partial [Arthrobacter sp.]|nr:hypothetical protein [Arthrobacter sp.]